MLSRLKPLDCSIWGSMDAARQKEVGGAKGGCSIEAVNVSAMGLVTATLTKKVGGNRHKGHCRFSATRRRTIDVPVIGPGIVIGRGSPEEGSILFLVFSILYTFDMSSRTGCRIS